MAIKINPNETNRALAYKLWMQAPNPMVTFFKTLDVTNLVKVSRKRNLKFNMLMDYCIGKAASRVKEFYILPVGENLIQYDNIALNTIVKNKNGDVNSCDLVFSENLAVFNKEYMTFTAEVAENCTDRDLSAESMVIGTSAITDSKIDGVDMGKIQKTVVPVLSPCILSAPPHADGWNTCRQVSGKPAERSKRFMEIKTKKSGGKDDEDTGLERQP